MSSHLSNRHTMLPPGASAVRESGLIAKEPGAARLLSRTGTLVSRNQELATLISALEGAGDRGTVNSGRIVTVTGPRGVGKTRLALQAATQLGGVWCELSGATNATQFCSVVADSLGIPLGNQGSVEGMLRQLGSALNSRGRCLVVFDNFEQLAEDALLILGHLGETSPDATFLVTSRIRLGVRGEQRVEVTPLDTTASLSRPSDASRLFLDRARSICPQLAFNPSAIEPINDITRQLGGLPLAIELAVGRLGELSPHQLAEQLEERFAVLAQIPTGGAGRPLAVHLTMRRTIDWSWELLTPCEQVALAQCSLFRGGFNLEAAHQVLDFSGFPDSPWALDIVQSLCDYSLVETYEIEGCGVNSPNDLRFRLPESVRDFAFEQLLAQDNVERVRQRHDDYYLRLATAAKGACQSRARERALRTLATEKLNLLAVHQRALGSSLTRSGVVRALRVAIALAPLLESHGPAQQRLDLVDTALAAERVLLAEDHHLLATGLLARAHALGELGRHEESLRALDRARHVAELAATASPKERQASRLGSAQRQTTRRLEGRAVASLADHERRHGDPVAAHQLYKKALETHRKSGDMPWRGRSQAQLASLHHAGGRIREARECYEDAIANLREHADPESEAIAIGNLASLELDQANYTKAKELLATALQLLTDTRSPQHVANFTTMLGSLALEQGEISTARFAFESAIRLQERVGTSRFLGKALAMLAQCNEFDGEFSVAAEQYGRAQELLKDYGHPALYGLCSAWFARLQGTQGQLRKAHENLRRSRSSFAATEATSMSAVPEICEAHVDIATAHQSLTGHHCDEAQIRLTRAHDVCRRLAEEHGQAPASEHVRLALQRLRNALEFVDVRGAVRPSTVQGPPSDAPPAAPVGEAVEITPCGRWFSSPGEGGIINLSTRKALRRILKALADQREVAPGTALHLADLTSIGWPGERMVAHAAASRVYTAIATLRRMGLRGILIRRDDGYILDTAVPIQRPEAMRR